MSGQVANICESKNFKDLIDKLSKLLTDVVTAQFRKLWEYILRSKKIPQDYLMVGIPEEGDANLLVTRKFTARDMNPKEVEHNDSTCRITAIMVLPLDEKTASPGAEIVSGGVGCSFVKIILTPSTKGAWGCKVDICLKKNTGILAYVGFK